MTRRRPQTSISLFPFLAVLVCAMGALILLLLVMTRKIHHEQYGDDAPANITASPVVVPPDLSLEIAALEAERDAFGRSLLDLEKQAGELERFVENQQSVVESLRQQCSKLETKLQAAGTSSDQSGIVDLQKRVSILRSKQVELQQRLDEQEQLLLAKQLRLREVTQAKAAAELKLLQANSSIVALRQQVKTAEKITATAGTDTVVEFTNTTGTTRTPIIVEVTKDGYTIQPSGIKIQKKDMDGFPVSDTPLMAAILAVHRERAKNSVTSQPYVLLLVRPMGSEAFYPAQGILANEKIHFGFELIGTEKEIAAGESAPAEIAAAETAMAEAHRRREKIYANIRFLGQGISPQGAAAPDPTRRGLSIGADGGVRSESSPLAQQSARRNYAGGVAPPPGFYERRAAAMAAEAAAADERRLKDSGTTSATDAVVDQFAQHYAESKGSATRNRFSGDFGSGGQVPGATDATTDQVQTSSEPEYGTQNRTENMFANAEPPLVSPLTPSKTKDPSSVSPITAEEQFAAMMSGPSSDSSPSSETAKLHVPTKIKGTGTPSFADEQASNAPVSPVLDLSHVDKDLLNRLPTTKNTSKVYATPVGVTVFLDSHHMTVGQQPAIPITADSLNSAMTQLLRFIEIEVADSKRTPKDEMLPVVKFIVSPGGERWRIPLAGSLKQIGIPNASVYELSPHIETTSEPGRASL